MNRFELRLKPVRRLLRRETVASDQFHLIAKAIQLVERGVNVGCDPDALEFCVHDRDSEDVVFVE